MATHVARWLRARTTVSWTQAVRPRLLLVRYLPAAGAGLVAAALAANVLLGLLPVAFIMATSILVGRVPEAVAADVGSAAWGSLVSAFLVAATTFVAQQLLVPVRDSLGTLIQRRVDATVHDGVIAATLGTTGIGPLEDQSTLDAMAEATQRLRDEAETPGLGCAGLVALSARYLRLAGLVCVIGMAASWPVAAALAAATLTFRYGQRGGLRRYARVWTDLVPLSRRADYLAGLAMGEQAAKEIRVFGLTSWLADRYGAVFRGWIARIWRERRRIYFRPYLGFTAVGLMIAITVFVALARAAVAGELSLTELALAAQATVTALLLGEYYPEADVQTQLGMQAASGVERLRRRVEAASAAVPAGHRPVDPPAAGGRLVRFNRVHFGYPGGERTVLDGLDLELPAGQCTAVVGVNGAGKTTIVKLLTRLYEPTAGTISVDGVDIRAFPADRWRRQLSVIFQDFVRYHMPAADNIAFGAVHHPRDVESVRQAAADAGILDAFGDLPRGLGTTLSRAYPDGIDLSGGQWQRVALARCLYAVRCGADIVVLDEPTAALDVRAELRFFEQFMTLTRGVTSLLISHRFSSVRWADRIAVIEAGRVVEQGTHEQLMARDGRYAGLFARQAARFAAGAGADDAVAGTLAMREAR